MWTTSLTPPRSPHETRPEPDPDPHRAGRRRHEPPAPDGPGRRHPGARRRWSRLAARWRSLLDHLRSLRWSRLIARWRSLLDHLLVRTTLFVVRGASPVVSTGRSLALAARPPTPLLDH